MMMPTSPVQAGSLRLPLFFMLAGILLFLLYHGSTLVSFAGWISGYARTPHAWSHAHLFVLGWGTMIAMGAVYQLITVILQTGLYGEKLGYVQFFVFTAGVIGLAFAFRTSEFRLLAVSASLAFFGILLFAWNIGVTLYKAKQWNSITISAACAIGYLVLAGLTGLLMGINFATIAYPEFHDRLFSAHLWFGAVGWFGLLITGFSYKLLPMFYLSHGHGTKLQTYVAAIWNTAVLTGAGSALAWKPWNVFSLAAVSLLAAAMLMYAAQIHLARRHRHKKNPGYGIRFSAGVSYAMAAVTPLLSVAAWNRPDIMGTAWATAGLWIYLWGWVGFTIMGYLSKIIPFLWWTHKYGKRIGKEKVPTMAQLLEDKYLAVVLPFLTVSSLFLFAAVGFGQDIFISLFGMLVSVISVFYILLILRVFAR